MNPHPGHTERNMSSDCSAPEIQPQMCQKPGLNIIQDQRQQSNNGTPSMETRQHPSFRQSRWSNCLHGRKLVVLMYQFIYYIYMNIYTAGSSVEILREAQVIINTERKTSQSPTSTPKVPVTWFIRSVCCHCLLSRRCRCSQVTCSLPLPMKNINSNSQQQNYNS